MSQSILAVVLDLVLREAKVRILKQREDMDIAKEEGSK